MGFNRFLPLLVPVSAFIFLELYFFKPSLVFVYSLFFLLFVFFSLREFINKSTKKEHLFNFYLFPFLSFVLVVAFTAILSSRFLIQLIFVLEFIFLYNYFKTIYYKLLNPVKFKNRYLKNFSAYTNFVLFYFLSSIIYAYQIYLKINFLILLFFFLIFSFLIVYQVFWSNELYRKENLFYIFLVVLCFLEIAWVVSFMSLNYYILGLLVSISYYIIIGLSRFFLLDKINKQIIKSYLVFGFLSIIFVLLTARWI